MRLACHFIAWCVFFMALNLGARHYQVTHWCELPDWAGPGSVEHDYCSRPDPRSEVEERPDFALSLETDAIRTPGRRIVVRRLQ